MGKQAVTPELLKRIADKLKQRPAKEFVTDYEITLREQLAAMLEENMNDTKEAVKKVLAHLSGQLDAAWAFHRNIARDYYNKFLKYQADEKAVEPASGGGEWVKAAMIKEGKWRSMLINNKTRQIKYI